MREEEKGNETELYQRIIFSPVSAHRACALHWWLADERTLKQVKEIDVR
jgi:hypothetical protein